MAAHGHIPLESGESAPTSEGVGQNTPICGNFSVRIASTSGHEPDIGDVEFYSGDTGPK